MPASVADFVKAAEESGILTADSLDEFLRGVAPDTDATALANRLVKDGRLTGFQAKYIYGGKAKSLVLGPYVVLDMLGKGGMGYVYKAEHRRMRRVVALKVIAKTALKSPSGSHEWLGSRSTQRRLTWPSPTVPDQHTHTPCGNEHTYTAILLGSRVLRPLATQISAGCCDATHPLILHTL